MTGIVLTRHELLWVLEQCGSGSTVAWPYPLRGVHWTAETDEDVARHRADTERRLRARGLLEPAPARALLDAGRAVAGWVLAADLVRREARHPRAAAALTDGVTAALLDSPEHAEAPVRVTPCPPAALAETLMTLVPPLPAGAGPAVRVLTPDTSGLPATRRTAAAREAAEGLLDTATSITQVGIADRAGDGAPRRVGIPVCWIDGPRGRHALRRPPGAPPGPPRPPLLVPTTGGQLLADIRTVLADASTPRPPGRSTA
jgi:hypothetical protein